MHLVDPAIETYLRNLYDDGDPIRREMEDLAAERHFPIVGPLVGPEGVVHCTELSPENVRLAESYLTRAGVWPRVNYHREEAVSALKRVGGTWDIIYNDIDKEGYPDTVEAAYQHLKPGGLFITDN